MSALADLVTVRPLEEGDRNFVRSSWLRSYYEVCRWAPRDEFMRVHWEVVEGLLTRPDARVLLATARSDPDTILGWLAGEPGAKRTLVHWGYVKSAWRAQGLARALVAQLLEGNDCKRVVVTHAMPDAIFARAQREGWAFRPGLAFYLGLDRVTQRDAA